MECKICHKGQMYIVKGIHRTEGDNSPETPTRLFYDQTAQCTNEKCKHTEIISNEIQLGE
jgi:hypothetical protein